MKELVCTIAGMVGGWAAHKELPTIFISKFIVK